MWGVEESEHLERVNTYRCNIYRGWTVCVLTYYLFCDSFSTLLLVVGATHVPSLVVVAWATIGLLFS